METKEVKIQAPFRYEQRSTRILQILGGLIEDFDNLKLEDEPVEVFLNLRH